MGRAYSNRFSITVVSAGALPTWRSGMSVNQYKSLSGTEPNTVACPFYSGSNNSNRVDKWSGAILDTSRHQLLFAATGGHLDYYGNETVKCDVSANVPGSWTTIYTGSSFAFLDGLVAAGGSNAARYTDGKPASVHSYYQYLYIPQLDKAFRFGAGSVSTQGSPKDAVEAFDLTARDWDAAGTYPDIPGSISGAGSAWGAVRDANGDVYLLHGNSVLRKFLRASFTWTTMGGGFPIISGYDSTAAAVDTTRNKILYLKGLGVAAMFNIGTPGWSTPTLTGAGAAGLNALNKGMGLVYVEGIDAYIARGGLAGGSTWYKITDPSDGTLVVTVLTSTGDTPPATANLGSPDENVYGKLLVDEVYGGVFYIPKFDQPVGFLRTH